MNYLLVVPVVEKGSARLESISNVPREYHMKAGEPSLDFPEDAAFEMSDDFPKDVRLLDYLKNVSAMMVVSARFKEALSAISGALEGNEVLPVKIVNHKKRAEKAPYFVIHQVGHVPCIDEKKSKGKKSSLDPNVFQFMQAMVLNEKQIPKERLLFRPAQFPRFPIVRRDVAEELGKLGLTGVKFAEIAGYAF
jgi:hypothetical protein